MKKIMLISLLLSFFSSLAFASHEEINNKNFDSYEVKNGPWKSYGRSPRTRVEYLTVYLKNPSGNIIPHKVWVNVEGDSNETERRILNLNRIQKNLVSFEPIANGALCFKTIGLIDEKSNSLVFDKILVDCTRFTK